MEQINVNIQGQTVEVRYDYKALKKIERENKSMFAVVKPTLENTEKLVKYGIEYSGINATDEDIENAVADLINKDGVFKTITNVVKHYIQTIHPDMKIDENKELNEEGLAQVNSLVSNMLGI